MISLKTEYIRCFFSSKRITITLGLIIFFLNISYAQAPLLNENTLIRLQTNSPKENAIFLTAENWKTENTNSSQSIFHFNYILEYQTVTFEKSSNNFNEKLLVYYYSGKPNIIVYQISSNSYNYLLNLTKSSKSINLSKTTEKYKHTIFKESNTTIEYRDYLNVNSSNRYSVLIYNQPSFKREIKKSEDIERARIKLETEKKSQYQIALNRGNEFYAIEKYDKAIIEFEMAANIFPANTEPNDRIKLCKEVLSQQFISKGNTEFKNFNYSSAINFYNLALNYRINSKLINDKIEDANKKIRETKVNISLNKAIELFELSKFDAAINEYKETLKIDSKNTVAITKIKEITELKEMLNKRKWQTFKYGNTNSQDLNNFKSNIENELNNIVENNDNGKISFQYKIEFDTLGINKSSYEIEKLTTFKKFDERLENIIRSSDLKPTSFGKYKMASKELISIDLNWRTTKVKYKSNLKGISTVDQSSIDQTVFENYIDNQNYKYGYFTFEVIDKKINNTDYTDLKLTNYRVAGPESAFLSMLLPGLGTLNVTQGQKGWKRFGLFLVTSGISVASKIYADAQYQKYLDAQDYSSSEKFYKAANISHKTFLVAASLSATIYIHDIIWVISKGNQNQKKSKNLREELNNNKSIEIRNQKIKL